MSVRAVDVCSRRLLNPPLVLLAGLVSAVALDLALMQPAGYVGCRSRYRLKSHMAKADSSPIAIRISHPAAL